MGEVRSNQIRTSYGSMTLEELMDQHVADMIDTNDPIRPSRKQRVTKVHTELVNAIEAMKNTDPAQFRQRDPATDANTEPGDDR